MDRKVSKNNILNEVVKCISHFYMEKDKEKFPAEIFVYNEQDKLILIILDGKNNIDFNFEKKPIEDTVTAIVEKDLLTGVYNKYYFKEKLVQIICDAEKKKKSIALFFIDFDKFKEINDTMGHEIGDLIIKETASRLKSTLSSKCILGRYGGDEFIVLAYPLLDKEEAYYIGKKIIEAFESPCIVEGYNIYLTVSVGIAIYPEHGENKSQLLKNADIAMYYAKEEKDRENKIKFFTEEMEKKVAEKFQIQNQMKDAVKNGEIQIYYQPIISIESGKLESAEALARWNSKTLGWILPEKFISIAEETGQMNYFGEYLLKRICQDIKRWESLGLNIVPIAVNISVKQLENKKFGDMVKKIIKRYKIDTKYIEFEITESVSTGDINIIQKNINKLKEIGIKISMDDFGTGYSSLEMLLNLHVDKIKIDKVFIERIGKERDEKIIMTIIQMARALGMKVVAEGVETKQQLDFLRNLNCELGQGYFWSKPMNSSDFKKYLIKNFNNCETKG
ncbi:putative bifunctional diguanylate cyclase/phosphodiesterase [Caminicella sporogenes]|uniref:putative bifunctional diguanylate cyclase/phosphodiesterase n=1 Tax=Caminicella sporogenes TaxID=166485 RepID=UPI00253FB293|nr:bifunctional diguanylate cyclase/phosphodiesterase [Caminicella sporogenes]WIF93983.1 bifunctional diguanylate cyclase/phosphodiesterase [Caminicella sporogenes]